MTSPSGEKKNIFPVLAPAANTTNNNQFRANTQDFWSCLIKHNGNKELNSRQPETRIMREELISFSSLFTSHLEVHLRRYMSLFFAEKGACSASKIIRIIKTCALVNVGIADV